jgi:integrase
MDAAMRRQRGNLERVGRTWFVRYRVSVTDPDTGEVSRVQQRRRLGSSNELRSKAAAQLRALQWLAHLEPSTLRPGLQITFAEFAARFLELHLPLLRRSSAKRYRGAVRGLIAEFGDTPLEKLDLARMQLGIVHLAERLSTATLHSMRALLMQVLRRARSDGFGTHAIERRALKLPRNSKPARDRRSFTLAELERLIEASAHPWRGLWACMGFAGLRAGEALALTWSNIDLEAGSIRIRQAAVDGEMNAPKTATSVGSVPMLPELAAALNAFRTVWTPNSAGLLFATRSGAPHRADNVRLRHLHPLLKRLGLPRAGLHAFRHSTPAIFNALGVGPQVIQSVMRHGSLRQTEAYLHSNSTDVMAALLAALDRRTRQQTTAASDNQ